MNSRIRNMVAAVGLFVVGGIGYAVFQPTPPDRTMAELRDAGLLGESTERFVMVCPEKLSARTARRLVALDFCDAGECRAGAIKRIARPAYRFASADGGLDEVVVPSLRVSLGADDGGGGAGDGSDDDEDADDALQFRTDDCYRLDCAGFSAGQRPNGGFRFRRPNQTEAAFCNGPSRLALQVPPCVMPNCWTLADGGWDDNAVVDCLAGGPYADGQGQPRWRGCNVLRAEYSSGTACVPTECSIVAGDTIDVLR